MYWIQWMIHLQFVIGSRKMKSLSDTHHRMRCTPNTWQSIQFHLCTRNVFIKWFHKYSAFLMLSKCFWHILNAHGNIAVIQMMQNVINSSNDTMMNSFIKYKNKHWCHESSKGLWSIFYFKNISMEIYVRLDVMCERDKMPLFPIKNS